MSKLEKIKRIILIILTLVLSGYLIYSGVKILNQDDKATQEKIINQVEDNKTK